MRQLYNIEHLRYNNCDGMTMKEKEVLRYEICTIP
jgi:hypothetical protein